METGENREKRKWRGKGVSRTKDHTDIVTLTLHNTNVMQHRVVLATRQGQNPVTSRLITHAITLPPLPHICTPAVRTDTLLLRKQFRHLYLIFEALV